MDIKQFEIQILPFKNKVFRLAYYLLSDRHEAEDTTQEIMMKLWSLKNSLEKIVNIQAFILKMTRNLCLDKLRARQIRTSETFAEQSVAVQERAANPHERTEQRNLLEVVQKIIATLPEMQRTVITLRDMQELEIQEIEAITGMNENAIKVNLSRARKKIRDALNAM
ncbi:MAG: sigma-70 family RNA polymerase sigma factor [Prevotellaceae bacterium]|jgi:RNA polymerase sigma-70 factor (ECF subfamily)|nr:sigma-70 family RNA polymerase sigma factor [Prevotellaceae bacterium]